MATIYMPITGNVWLTEGREPYHVNKMTIRFIMRQFFRSIPKELDEAAFIDGAGHFQILFQVIMNFIYVCLNKLGCATIIFIAKINNQVLCFRLGSHNSLARI